MAYVNYTAQRAVISSHVLGNSYDLDFNASKADPSIGEKGGRITTSLGGNPSANLGYIEDVSTIITGPIDYNQANFELWNEFLKSIMNLEPFTLDEDGSSTSPSWRSRSVRLQDRKKFTLSRSSSFGSFYMVVGFRVVDV